MILDNSKKTFLELLRAGLWGGEVWISKLEKHEYEEVYRLAEEQSVVGVVALGLENIKGAKVPKPIALTFAGCALQIEQRNQAMDYFLGQLIDKLRESNIYTHLVKGQGIAQCYEKPLWRASGDIDFFLSRDNYERAKELLLPMASYVEIENDSTLHQALTIDSWVVELHGSLRCGLSKRIDKVLDEIQDSIIFRGNVRSWMNENSQIFLPREDEDVVYVFSHILQHFFKGGIGIRQLCDLSRLLWTYKDSINQSLLLKRLKSMKVMTEWKAFGCLIVDTLGLPSEAMPFYDKSYNRKADKILSYILEVGNFGHNKDVSYQSELPALSRKMVTFWRQAKDSFRLASIFPIDASTFLLKYLSDGCKKAIKEH